MSYVDQLVSVLEKAGLSFFHFTDTRNLPSIKQHGLLSKRELDARALCTVPGGNQWSLDADKRVGMDRYVHLCLIKQHPMEWKARQEGRIGTSKFLRVDPNVLKIDGVKMTDEVSNKRGVVAQDPETLIPNLDFKVIYTRTDWRDPEVQERRKKAKLYEILVPDQVPPHYLSGL